MTNLSEQRELAQRIDSNALPWQWSHPTINFGEWTDPDGTLTATQWLDEGGAQIRLKPSPAPQEKAGEWRLEREGFRNGESVQVRQRGLIHWQHMLGTHEPAWHDPNLEFRLEPISTPEPKDFARPPYPHTLHNPDNLTPKQVGEGYRLLLPEEVDGRHRNKAEFWYSEPLNIWSTAGSSDAKDTTYRLPISVPWPIKEPKPSTPETGVQSAGDAKNIILDLLKDCHEDECAHLQLRMIRDAQAPRFEALRETHPEIYADFMKARTEPHEVLLRNRRKRVEVLTSLIEHAANTEPRAVEAGTVPTVKDLCNVYMSTSHDGLRLPRMAGISAVREAMVKATPGYKDYVTLKVHDRDEWKSRAEKAEARTAELEREVVSLRERLTTSMSREAMNVNALYSELATERTAHAKTRAELAYAQTEADELRAQLASASEWVSVETRLPTRDDTLNLLEQVLWCWEDNGMFGYSLDKWSTKIANRKHWLPIPPLPTPAPEQGVSSSQTPPNDQKDSSKTI